MDHLVDHLTDAHDAFSWVTGGRELPSFERDTPRPQQPPRPSDLARND